MVLAPGNSDPPRRSLGSGSLSQSGFGSPFSVAGPDSDTPHGKDPTRRQDEENGHDSLLLQNDLRQQMELDEHGRARSAHPSGAQTAESAGLLGAKPGDEEEEAEPGFD